MKIQNPISLFQEWFQAAKKLEGAWADRMTLATANHAGRVAARVVLIKEVSDRGFVFFTNYESHKSHDLAENAQAALVFYWPVSGKQVRIEGTVEKTSRQESESYFQRRPRLSQLGAWASLQSRPLASREALLERVNSFDQQYPGAVPCPENWGGFRLTPRHIEFWEDGDGRLHERRSFSLNASSEWESERLYP